MYNEAGKNLKSARKTATMNRRFTFEISKIPRAEKLLMCSHRGGCPTDCSITKLSESYMLGKTPWKAQLGLKENY